MIRAKKKPCVDCGNVTYIFSKGRCQSCARKTYQPKCATGKYIKKTWTGRKDQGEYEKVCAELDAEAVAKCGYIRCFFCGEKIFETPTHHHLKGRDGSLMTNKKYIVHGHFLCHVIKYHSYTVADLKKESWYEWPFLSNLKALDEDLYRKELRKQDKA